MMANKRMFIINDQTLQTPRLHVIENAGNNVVDNVGDN